jgi:hypothetical protein
MTARPPAKGNLAAALGVAHHAVDGGARGAREARELLLGEGDRRLVVLVAGVGVKTAQSAKNAPVGGEIEGVDELLGARADARGERVDVDEMERVGGISAMKKISPRAKLCRSAVRSSSRASRSPSRRGSPTPRRTS